MLPPYSEGIENRDGRAWCFELQYPNLKKVWFGTVYVEREAKELEVERQVVATALEYIPPGFKVIKLIPGALVFLPEKTMP